jgi:hypothetical protein
MKKLFILAAAATMVAGCSETEELAQRQVQQQTENDVVSFTVYTNRATRAGEPGIMTTDALKGTDDIPGPGFGIFAYHTNNSKYDERTSTPNFMYNQQVQWSEVSPLTYAWTYTPVKYWPNDNQPADDTGATGSQEHNYVSFFAYAPYNGTGLTLSGNTATGAPTIGYTWVNSTDPASQADLLYATPVTDCYKTMTEGYGTVSGRVPFVFHHALAAIEFKVRRKEASGDQIFLQSLSLNASADATAASSSQATLNTGGTFNLGTSAWASFSTGTPVINYSSSNINTDLISTGTGVTATTNETAHDLTSYTPNLLLLMPQESTVTIPFTLSYTLGGAAKSPSATITFTQPTGGWAIEMGRKYTVVFVIDGGEVESYLLRAKEAEQW